MTDATEVREHRLAEQLLRAALQDLRREALAGGREALFECVLARLVNPTATADDDPSAGWTAAELALASKRLQARYREIVNQRLRALEPEPARRRALRQRLRAAMPGGALQP